MKSTPAVFLTSLAVSAFSLTAPLPTATTVLNLFIGEDISVQQIAQAEEETSQPNTHRVEGSLPETACPDTEPLRKEETVYKADAPRASVSGNIRRLVPDIFVEQLTRAYVKVQRDRLLLRERRFNTAPSYVSVEQRVKRLYRVVVVSSFSFLRSM